MITFILFAMAIGLSVYLIYRDYVTERLSDCVLTVLEAQGGRRYDDVLIVLKTKGGRFMPVKLTLLASYSTEEGAIKCTKDAALKLGIPYVDYKSFCRLF